MNKYMNEKETYFKEVSEGFLKSHQDVLSLTGDLKQIVRRRSPEKKEVAVIGLGDGGHLPCFAGYVQEGMLHGSVSGEVFQAPSHSDILEVIRHTEMGKGCILIPLLWNEETEQELNIALEEAKKLGIDVSAAYIRDDCMQPRNDPEKRSGHAGVYYACKIAGSAAAEGKSKEEILDILRRVNENIRTAGNYDTFFRLPQEEKAFREIPEDMTQVGVGLHGEEGFETVPFPSAYLVSEHLFRHRLNKELQMKEGEEVALMVNDLGSCSLDERYILAKEICTQFENKGVIVSDLKIGRYVTTLDSDAMSLTALRLDEELKRLLKE